MSQRSADRRLFVALWPTTPVLREIELLSARLPALGRWIAPENVHLTLAFLGNVSVERLADTQQALSHVRIPGFGLTFDRIGTWRRSRVLWLGTSRESPAIQSLADQVLRVLEDVGFPSERRAFRTHVTLARKVDRPPRTPEFRPIQWPVDRFSLTASELRPEGARYTAVGEWRLL